MKPVSVNAQRKIMYIPFVNVLNMFLCIYNLNVVRINKKHEMKFFLYFFGYSAPSAVVYSFMYRAVSGVIPVLEPLMYAAGMYLIPLIMSYGLIKFQEKYVFTDDAIKN